MRKAALLLGVATMTMAASPVSDLGSRSHASAQAAADVVRELAGADAAFLPAGLLKEPSAGTDLAGLLQFPTDEIVVVGLKGSEMKQALERSVSNYPSSNSAFLQVSGLSVTFSESAAPEARILEVKVGDSTLSSSKDYTVAMPASLARGALGYFKIWDKTQIKRSLGTTLGAALKGKTGSAKGARYLAKP